MPPLPPLTQIRVQPDLATVAETLAAGRLPPSSPSDWPNMVPLVASFPAEFLNPSSAYLKLSAKLGFPPYAIACGGLLTGGGTGKTQEQNQKLVPV